MTESRWRSELRAMVGLAVPVVLSELGWMLQGVVDTIMVGSLGASAIGAVALGNAVYYTPSLFGFGLLLGLDTLVSQAWGRKDHDACHGWLAQGIYLALLLTVPLMLVVWALSYGFAQVGIAAAVAGPAGGYLRVLNWSTLPLLVYGGTRRYLQAVGEVRVVTITFVVANLVNWLGNWVFIYGHWGMPVLGVRGSALSTVLSRVLMAAMLLGFAWRYERRRGHPLFAHWAAPHWAQLRQMVRLGLPAAGQIVLEVGAWNLATLSAGWLSAAELATHQIVLNYASLTYMVPLGISAATAVSVGHAVGAGDGGRARRAGWLGMGLGVGFMVLAALCFVSMPGPLVRIYTADAGVLAACRRLLVLAAAFQIFDAMQTIATGALRGVGETRTPMVANLVGYWLLGLPLGIGLCFGLGWGIYGLWIGLTAALILIAVCLLGRWRGESGRLVRAS